jgi:pSer/pThr/pTyr-binding forkhead associated (FHA) protein/subtilisin family serine protease
MIQGDCGMHNDTATGERGQHSLAAPQARARMRAPGPLLGILALILLSVVCAAPPPRAATTRGALPATNPSVTQVGATRPRWQPNAAHHLSRPVPAPLRNDVSRRSIMQVEPIWDQLALYGQGQIIAVADTGLDTGDPASLSADFAGRLKQAFALGRPGDWSDPHGHGTHVAASALGSGSLSGSDPANHRYTGSFAGVAPEAQLVFQSILDAEGGLGGLPDDLGVLLDQAYDAGARVHTNSWGGNFFIKPLARFLSAGRYSLEAVSVDRFVWEHPDMVVLFAAGNHGVDILTASADGVELPPADGIVDPESLAVPSTAKNVITVGATEGLRTEGGHADKPWSGEGDLLSALLGDSFPAEPIASDLPSDNAQGMAPFSSRGPANDGRIKPDVVAPGTNIISARSHASGAEELFGAYDEEYVYCSGTSMSTPLVAGVVTLIRQWYVERQGLTSPSAALIKATLINGTTDIRPGQYGPGPTQDVPDAWPNPVSGWGRVNLRASIAPEDGGEVWFVDEAGGLAAGQESAFTRYAGAASEPLRVTLVWTDPPGPVEPEGFRLPGLTEPPAPALVNDLDLIVEAPDGRRFLGNMGGNPDRLNPVEAVRVTDPPEGDYQIVVRAHQVPQGRQPFALVVAGQQVVSGRIEAPPQEGAERQADDVSVDTGQAWVIPLLAGLAGLLLAAGGTLVYIWRRRRPGVVPASSSRSVPSRGPAGGRSSALAPAGDVVMTRPSPGLRAERGPLAGKSFRIERLPFSLGRSADNDLSLPDAPVSRHHAQIERREGRWYLVDLNSANGTFLNRQRLESPQPLHSGDVIGLGESVFLFTAPTPLAEARQPTQKPRRSILALAVGVGIVVVLVVAAAVLLLTGTPPQEETGSGLPGLPTVELPDITLPAVELPTIGLPTGVPSVEIPTGVPTVEIPKDVPTGLPIPTGGFVVPTFGVP